MAATCKNIDGYDAEFFTANGYERVPRTNQVYVTSLWNGIKKTRDVGFPSFVFVYDYIDYGTEIEIDISKVFLSWEGYA